MRKDEELKEFYIPDNITFSKKKFGMDTRRFMETLIVELVWIVIMYIIPIPFVPNMFIAVIGGIALAIPFSVGRHDESITQYLITCIKFRKKKKKRHLRHCDESAILEEVKEKNASPMVKKIKIGLKVLGFTK